MDLKGDSISTLLKALRFASEKHKMQRRKDSKESPYINHPIAVAETLLRVGRVEDFVTIIASILHDTLEDTDTTPRELEKEFGEAIRSVVEEVSDDKSLEKDDRKRLQIENAPYKSDRAKLIKLADKICNIKDIIESPPSDWSMDRKRKYISWAREVVNQIRGTNAELEKSFDKAWSDAGGPFCISRLKEQEGISQNITENKKYPKIGNVPI